ncbi:NADH:ubiquinone oxidoreductase chain I-like protein [Caldisphaera lagunensis DSM 15908]|uniref:NADH:ubiquinone oxidoreductase chain I-like protein n=1 Tax=Caldisphaera lagunensis (strain DSM 15908 / JCM 11604 / ANMR 0165 / IC-154) TaxID=1056495 RepID=L0ACJ7_CALLD|nr:NADH-quinone oxidoreductase subunit NuoI [Caldisphaera lagunensis]AFZ71139.1 NADH:ubiquinone oxidoreductase chain I-like protein [Caldisphaera lagunensis DSM 15908]
MPAKVALKRNPKKNPLGRVFAGNIGALAVGLKYFFDPNRITLLYPHEYIKLRQGYRGFIVLIQEKCISCSSCARICPARAMKMLSVKVFDKRLKKEMVKKFPVINYNRCIFCGYCVDVCPTEALYHVAYHDLVYMNMQDMILSLEDFQKEPENVSAKEGVPIRYIFDEKRGLVKIKYEEEKKEIAKPQQQVPQQQTSQTTQPNNPQPKQADKGGAS